MSQKAQLGHGLPHIEINQNIQGTSGSNLGRRGSADGACMARTLERKKPNILLGKHDPSIELLTRYFGFNDVPDAGLAEHRRRTKCARDWSKARTAPLEQNSLEGVDRAGERPTRPRPKRQASMGKAHAPPSSCVRSEGACVPVNAQEVGPSTWQKRGECMHLHRS